MISENDALGGQGSLVRALQTIAVTGISRVVDGHLSRKYPLTSFNENVTIDATGRVKPTGAPAKAQTATSGIIAALNDPRVIVGGLFLLGTVALFVALRR